MKFPSWWFFFPFSNTLTVISVVAEPLLPVATTVNVVDFVPGRTTPFEKIAPVEGIILNQLGILEEE